MKSRILTCINVITLFAALAVPVGLRLAAQEQGKEHTRYRLVDLGTLGGPASHLPGPPPVSKVLNNRGMVAGYADTSTPDPFPSACFNAPDCFVSHAFQWKNGFKTDLGALVAGWSSAITAISDTGLIVGLSENGIIDPLIGPEPRAVLWKDGQIIDLGTLGGNGSIATGVNSRGQIIGFSSINTIPDPFSFLGGPIHPFIWKSGVMHDLGTLGGTDAFAAVINERGQVAGNSLTSDTVGPSGSPSVDSFLWQNDKMIDLGTLGGTSSAPNDLNNRGQVVGLSNLTGDPGCPNSCQTHPFLWDRGVMTDLGTLGGDNGQATAINDQGEVVGYADLPRSTTHHAFLWKDGTMADLGALEGLPFSAAWYISPKGQIVGHVHDSVANAVLWENGGRPLDLNTLIPSGSPLHLQDAFYINERGEIAGYGVPSGCANFETCGHAYVMIPCSEGQEGCADSAEGPASATQSSPASTSQRPSTTTPANPALSGRGMLDRLRARRFLWYPVPSRGTATKN